MRLISIPFLSLCCLVFWAVFGLNLLLFEWAAALALPQWQAHPQAGLFKVMIFLAGVAAAALELLVLVRLILRADRAHAGRPFRAAGSRRRRPVQPAAPVRAARQRRGLCIRGHGLSLKDLRRDPETARNIDELERRLGT